MQNEETTETVREEHGEASEEFNDWLPAPYGIFTAPFQHYNANEALQTSDIQVVQAYREYRRSYDVSKISAYRDAFLAHLHACGAQKYRSRQRQYSTYRLGPYRFFARTLLLKHIGHRKVLCAINISIIVLYLLSLILGWYCGNRFVVFFGIGQLVNRIFCAFEGRGSSAREWLACGAEEGLCEIAQNGEGDGMGWNLTDEEVLWIAKSIIARYY